MAWLPLAMALSLREGLGVEDGGHFTRCEPRAVQQATSSGAQRDFEPERNIRQLGQVCLPPAGGDNAALPRQEYFIPQLG